jgi:hypothetical protein
MNPDTLFIEGQEYIVIQYDEMYNGHWLQYMPEIQCKRLSDGFIGWFYVEKSHKAAQKQCNDMFKETWERDPVEAKLVYGTRYNKPEVRYEFASWNNEELSITKPGENLMNKLFFTPKVAYLHNVNTQTIDF